MPGMFNQLKEVKGMKARREDKGLTVTQLSQIARVAYATVKRAEAGAKVRADIHKWIEEALNG